MTRYGGHVFHRVIAVKRIEQDHAYSVLVVQTRDFQIPYMIGHN
jgi:hypothetical protein